MFVRGRGSATHEGRSVRVSTIAEEHNLGGVEIAAQMKPSSMIGLVADVPDSGSVRDGESIEWADGRGVTGPAEATIKAI